MLFVFKNMAYCGRFGDFGADIFIAENIERQAGAEQCQAQVKLC